MFHAGKVALDAIALVALAAAGPGRQVSVANGNCEVFRVLPDGREIRVKTPDNVSVSRGASSGRSNSVSVRSRSGHSGSSASAFSSSSTGGGGMARAVSSTTDEEGRTVTTIHDGKGCRVVIDDR